MENLRASGLMVLSMALFALEDMFVKLLSGAMPVGQIVMILGGLGGAVFWALLALRGKRLLTRDLLRPAVLTRNAGEVIGTLGFVSALALTELSSASAILQTLPLAIVLGAAVFLREPVGWRRWTAILTGFAGVLLIVQPWGAGFSALSLLAVFGVIGLALRDLTTRGIPASVPSNQLSASAFLALVPAGAVLMAVTGDAPVPVGAGDALRFVACMVFGVLGYATLVMATRVGEASVIAPFRYSRLVFALIVAVVVFGERPDLQTLTGSAVIVGSGSYAMWREALRRRRAARAAALAAGRAHAASLSRPG